MPKQKVLKVILHTADGLRCVTKKVVSIPPPSTWKQQILKVDKFYFNPLLESKDKSFNCYFRYYSLGSIEKGSVNYLEMGAEKYHA